MNELGPTFKDNCLIGVFSCMVPNREAKKGSDNCIIMQPQRIRTFVAEL